MTTFKRSYLRSELPTAPVRRCPDCGRSARPRRGLQPLRDLEGGLEPEYLVSWQCGTPECEGERGF